MVALAFGNGPLALLLVAVAAADTLRTAHVRTYLVVLLSARTSVRTLIQ